MKTTTKLALALSAMMLIAFFAIIIYSQPSTPGEAFCSQLARIEQTDREEVLSAMKERCGQLLEENGIDYTDLAIACSYFRGDPCIEAIVLTEDECMDLNFNADDLFVQNVFHEEETAAVKAIQKSTMYLEGDKIIVESN